MELVASPVLRKGVLMGLFLLNSPVRDEIFVEIIATLIPSSVGATLEHSI